MSRATAHPFAGLLGLSCARLPSSASTTVVICGRKVHDARQVDEALPIHEPGDGTAEAWADKMRAEVERARQRQRYQLERQNPDRMAKRKAWIEANREKVRAYKKAYDEAHRRRIRPQQSAWAKAQYHADPDAARAKRRAYYADNRERILAKLAEKRLVAKAAKAAGATS